MNEAYQYSDLTRLTAERHADVSSHRCSGAPDKADLVMLARTTEDGGTLI